MSQITETLKEQLASNARRVEEARQHLTRQLARLEIEVSNVKDAWNDYETITEMGATVGERQGAKVAEAYRELIALLRKSSEYEWLLGKAQASDVATEADMRS